MPAGSARATVVAVVAAAVTLPFGESVIGVQPEAIARTFDADDAPLGWVVNAYRLTFATSMLGAADCATANSRRGAEYSGRRPGPGVVGDGS